MESVQLKDKILQAKILREEDAAFRTFLAEEQTNTKPKGWSSSLWFGFIATEIVMHRGEFASLVSQEPH
ncbi:Threonylcarbamoyl-AMP synthase [Frankliniella fusca]|uniref:Threonylcarbamoyl-AMP synthase n=1 Tax=Frankliniella fusca TaxID=407009 RepID=A0AAE1GRH1_9NEOP|nr:Threonylcarbamoyl-AMP synthase [Frankliniella fusca]